MRKFIAATVLAVAVLGSISLSSADAQYRRRGTYYAPRAYYTPTYYNYSYMTPSTVFSPGYSYQSYYFAPSTVVPSYNNYYYRGYNLNPAYSSYYYSTPSYYYRQLGWRRW